ncbi:PepSY domain-containing protein [Neobacillus kokaensis]|uniref:PepSY domain-containing protein n=1 Tax=Neobacillus kokaensis TaxID=2759023 RepID=A0ABQ3N235_9BACI|nr:PepSY domain-containing protein [Neobacillus kokaensis]GHH97563.1 hypothetical protein AM1BK_11060 [Neobacillus kokaensis]
MKLLTQFLIAVTFIGGLCAAAYAMTNNHTATEQTNPTSYPIRHIEAIEAAIKVSKGGFVKNIQAKEEEGIKKYEVNIVNQGKEIEVDINGLTGKVLEVSKDIQTTTMTKRPIQSLE